MEQIVTLARQRGLDFVVLSDHNTVSQHALLAALQDSVPDVLLLQGAEVTTYQGHGNALGATAYVDHRMGLDGNNVTTLLNAVRAAGGLFVVNHPELDLGNACIGCAWRHENTPWDLVTAMEIHTGPFEPVASLFTPLVLQRWEELHAQGFRITAVGGSDDHKAGLDLGNYQSPLGSPTTLVRAETVSNNDGSFELLKRLPPGNYELRGCQLAADPGADIFRTILQLKQSAVPFTVLPGQETAEHNLNLLVGQ